MKTTFDEPFRRQVISKTAIGLGITVILGTALRHWFAPIETDLWIKNFAMASLIFSVPYLMKRGVRTQLGGLLLVICIFLIAIRAGMLNGGVRAPASALFLLIPMIGFFSAGILGGTISLILSLSGIGFLYLAQQHQWVMPLNSPENYAQYKTAIYLLAVVAAFGIGAVYERTRRYSEKLITDMSLRSIHSAKMAALGEMAAGIAHEINNPLTILSGFSKLIQRELSSEHPDLQKVKGHVEKVVDTSKRIEAIVKGLKTFSTPDAASPFTIHPLSSLIEDSVSLCGDRFGKGRVALKVSCDEDLRVNCRPVQISQVILNLLGNAYDAIEKLEERWVQVEAKSFDSRILLTVTDSGKGIHPEVAKKMMEPFYTTKEVGRGTGLGLSISLGIARDHAGVLAYDPGSEHTRFVLDLPRAF